MRVSQNSHFEVLQSRKSATPGSSVDSAPILESANRTQTFRISNSRRTQEIQPTLLSAKCSSFSSGRGRKTPCGLLPERPPHKWFPLIDYAYRHSTLVFLRRVFSWILTARVLCFAFVDPSCVLPALSAAAFLARQFSSGVTFRQDQLSLPIELLSLRLPTYPITFVSCVRPRVSFNLRI